MDFWILPSYTSVCCVASNAQEWLFFQDHVIYLMVGSNRFKCSPLLNEMIPFQCCWPTVVVTGSWFGISDDLLQVPKREVTTADVSWINLPPILMEVKKWFPPIVVTSSNTAIFHFHDYGRKGTILASSFMTRISKTARQTVKKRGNWSDKEGTNVTLACLMTMLDHIIEPRICSG